ncbi:hypothetical protein VCBJG01_3012 [Vibrio cholerae BJG-01]|nr:hypothetical protein VCBJG01_3012 [Vibrio cholerae BJG-01]
MFLGLVEWEWCKTEFNKRLKRDCQRVAFPVLLSRGGYGCCV